MQAVTHAGGSPPAALPSAGAPDGGGAPSFAAQGSSPPSPQDLNPRPAAPAQLPHGLASRRSSDSGSQSAHSSAASLQAVGDARGGALQSGGRSGDARPRIHPLPPKPLSLLRELVQHLKVCPRQFCRRAACSHMAARRGCLRGSWHMHSSVN